jgi:polar amino acid transport system substrate-binding protein
MLLSWQHFVGYSLFVGVLIAGGAARSDEAPVKLACNDFPPLKIEHPDASGLPGSDVEILQEIFKRAGIGLSIEYFPWKRAFVEAQRGEVDGLCSCSYVAERENIFHFTDEIGQTSVGLFTLANTTLPEITSLVALKAEVGDATRVGVVAGYNLETDLDQFHVNRDSVVDDKATLEMLQKRRFDYLYSYKAPIDYIRQSKPDAPELRYTELRSNPYYVCLSKQVPRNAGLLAKINTAIAGMRKDGAIDQILDKYR